MLAQFESRTLPFDQWTHRMHVKVAYRYLCDHPLEEAPDAKTSFVEPDLAPLPEERGE